jgi:hypothetical protein
MKIVCPYTNLHPETKASLPTETEFVPVHGYGDYFDLLARLWAKADSFILIEHDIEIHSGVIASFMHCNRPWCQFPYLLPGGYQPAFGCTRFSRRLIMATPTCLDEVYASENQQYQNFRRRPDPFDILGRQDDPDGRKYWTTLDTRVGNWLQRHGYYGHLHQPAVMHHSARNNPDRIYPPSFSPVERTYQLVGQDPSTEASSKRS